MKKAVLHFAFGIDDDDVDFIFDDAIYFIWFQCIENTKELKLVFVSIFIIAGVR